VRGSLARRTAFSGGHRANSRRPARV